MIVYRLAQKKFAKDLSGKGAELYGGRWNSVGVSMLYTTSSIALAVLEVLVRTPLHTMPLDYQLIKIYLPESEPIKEIAKQNLPENWNQLFNSPWTQKLGDDFIQQKEYLALKVPSATASGDFNFLLNPSYNGFNQVKFIELSDFAFDARFFVGAK